MGFTGYFLVLTIRTKVETIEQQKYNVKDGVTHRYIIIRVTGRVIVILRADTKRFTQRRCQKIDIKIIKKKKSCQRSPSDS